MAAALRLFMLDSTGTVSGERRLLSLVARRRGLARAAEAGGGAVDSATGCIGGCALLDAGAFVGMARLWLTSRAGGAGGGMGGRSGMSIESSAASGGGDSGSRSKNTLRDGEALSVLRRLFAADESSFIVAGARAGSIVEGQSSGAPGCDLLRTHKPGRAWQTGAERIVECAAAEQQASSAAMHPHAHMLLPLCCCAVGCFRSCN